MIHMKCQDYWQMIHMKCQDLFSMKKKKKIRMSSAENLLGTFFYFYIQVHNVYLGSLSNNQHMRMKLIIPGPCF